MTERTPLFDEHLAAGGKMVDFAGWDLPVAYGSQLAEHEAVRTKCGMFDVSHMGVVEVHGAGVESFMQELLANNVGRMSEPGRAIYSCMLNEQGGVIDDVIAYRLANGGFRLVINASNRQTDLAWMRERAAGYGLIIDLLPELALIAVQGPLAREVVHGLLDEEVSAQLRPVQRFGFWSDGELFIARTGYTGEDGYELIMPAAEAVGWWQRLRAAGVQPCGLGARDSLRLEAGLNLHGQDMDASVTPLECGLDWTIAFDPPERQFIGRRALEEQWAEGITRKQVGLLLLGKGVIRHGYEVTVAGTVVGEVTSGGLGPTLGRSIALARVKAGCPEEVYVRIRGKDLPALVVPYPFARNGRVQIDSSLLNVQA
jgi:aminomethyltransferase